MDSAVTRPLSRANKNEIKEEDHIVEQLSKPPRRRGRKRKSEKLLPERIQERIAKPQEPARLNENLETNKSAAIT